MDGATVCSYKAEYRPHATLLAAFLLHANQHHVTQLIRCVDVVVSCDDVRGRIIVGMTP